MSNAEIYPQKLRIENNISYETFIIHTKKYNLYNVDIKHFLSLLMSFQFCNFTDFMSALYTEN